MAIGMHFVNINWLKYYPVVHSKGLRQLPRFLLKSSCYLESVWHNGDNKVVGMVLR